MTQSPFTTVNQMLVYNKCWLCEQSFPRGTKKKVFQVSHVLDYCKAAYEKSDTPSFATNHMQQCYEFYVAFITAEYAKRSLAREPGQSVVREVLEALNKQLADEDVEIWMSGLVCYRTPECMADLQLFLPQADMKTTDPNSIVSDSGVFSIKKSDVSDKECPPGCNCDNPWPFLS